MGFIDIIPIEYDGMSIFTLIILVLATIGSYGLLKWIVLRLDGHDEKFNAFDKIVKEVREDFADGRVQFSELKGSIRETQIVVERIDRSLGEIAKTNADVISLMLKKLD